MISVVLPTIWRGSQFQYEIEKLNSCPYIGEIIVINNDPVNTPPWYTEYTKDNGKFLQVNMSRNLYVNPAWNLGVAISNCEHVMLHQDDMGFDNYDFLVEIDNQLKQEDCLIGCDKSAFTVQQNQSISFREIKTRDYGFGCAMFFRRSSYKNIPSFYKLWKGDDCLIELYKHKNKPIRTFSGVRIHGKISETIDGSSEFDFKFKEGDANFGDHLKEYLYD
jgi:hypothetical protein